MRHVCNKYKIRYNDTLWTKAHLVLMVHLLLFKHLVGGHMQRLNEIMSLNMFELVCLERKILQVVLTWFSAGPKVSTFGLSCMLKSLSPGACGE